MGEKKGQQDKSDRLHESICLYFLNQNMFCRYLSCGITHSAGCVPEPILKYNKIWTCRSEPIKSLVLWLQMSRAWRCQTVDRMRLLPIPLFTDGELPSTTTSRDMTDQPWAGTLATSVNLQFKVHSNQIILQILMANICLYSWRYFALVFRLRRIIIVPSA